MSSDGGGSHPTPKHYSFETQPPNVFVGRRKMGGDREVFIERLGLSKDDVTQIGRSLDDFVLNHHANIAWYDKAIEHELTLRRRYFYGSLALLVLIPAGIAFLTSRDTNSAGPISAGLSGLFGFHRGMTAWLDKRQLVALYSKTRAQLKAAVYDFEQKWGPAQRAGQTLGALMAALGAATVAARLIVSAEQDAHYEVEAAPTFGLDDLVGAAATKSAQVTTAFATKPTADETARAAAERAARESQAKIVQFDALLNDYRQKLAASKSDEEKQSLIAAANDIASKRRAAELDHAISVATLNSV